MNNPPEEVIVYQVAPFTGAWIETFVRVDMSHVVEVAPFTGAWIETNNVILRIVQPTLSHPLQVRGLKLRCCATSAIGLFRRSFTGAWIETLLGAE